MTKIDPEKLKSFQSEVSLIVQGFLAKKQRDSEKDYRIYTAKELEMILKRSTSLAEMLQRKTAVFIHILRVGAYGSNRLDLLQECELTGDDNVKNIILNSDCYLLYFLKCLSEGCKSEIKSFRQRRGRPPATESMALLRDIEIAHMNIFGKTGALTTDGFYIKEIQKAILEAIGIELNPDAAQKRLRNCRKSHVKVIRKVLATNRFSSDKEEAEFLARRGNVEYLYVKLLETNRRKR